jgi:hypothetical protein
MGVSAVGVLTPPGGSGGLGMEIPFFKLFNGPKKTDSDISFQEIPFESNLFLLS